MTTRPFSLAGLFRLRRLQEDEAAGNLARASGRAREHDAVQARARRALEGFSSQPADVTTLRAIAASRASYSSMLSDLTAAAVQHSREEEDAQDAYTEAHSRTVRLAKLETAHRAAALAQELRDEQIALDEIASGSWQRRAGGAR